MIDNFFKDIEEYKHTEYMILKSNTCRSLKSINDVLREDLKKGMKKEEKKEEKKVVKKVVKKEYTY
jgi:hydroxymethylglutaryl-CoA reductase